ncbi:YcnI family protein [Actinotalea solisilvae]|uniref:YcnI family protein n=1 Tax=Actinotalea solisilvae TaxID=2072922 RepID=UPI0018F24F6B|nr:YcnI family protein [Actinotalea solisilvae]
MRGSTSARRGAVAAIVAVAVLGPAAPAAAHVTIEASTTAAGATAVLTLTVPHGCDGSPTTAVTVRVPDEVTAVTPSGTTAWATEVRAEADATLVTYRAASPLPDGEHAVLELGVRLPDAEGTTLAFPTVQTCEQGEVAWIEVAAAGASADGLARPAPTLVLTARDPAAPPPAVPTAAPGTSASTPTDGTAAPVAAAAGVTALLGAVLGGGALVRRRHRP